MLPSPRAYLQRAVPAEFGHDIPQEDGVRWLQEALARSFAGPSSVAVRRASALYQRLLSTAQIGSRRSCLLDYTHRDWQAMRLYRPRLVRSGGVEIALPWCAPPLEDRMALFAEEAERIAEGLFPAPAAGVGQDGAAPDALLQVSCTGYDSPSSAQRLAVRRGWTEGCRLLQLGHMGCYAALPALQLAADLACALPQRPDGADPAIALLLLELCTLHLRPAELDADQIVLNSLFADGAIRLDVRRRPAPGGAAGLAILAYEERIVPDTLPAMTWRPGASAFLMTLGREVPTLVGAPLRAAVEGFLGRAGLAIRDVDRFAIHPGGPRIIDAVAGSLGLGAEGTRHSREVLRARGNMSSCTLPHVWHALLSDPAVAEGELALSLAFGPGLTIALNLLRKGG